METNTWKTQLTIVNSYISTIDNNEQCVMHSKNDNMEIIINDEEYEVIKQLYDSF